MSEKTEYTWISLVDMHTGKNVGCLIMDGHVEVDSFIITTKYFAVASARDKKFYSESEKGRIYLQAELRKHIDIVNMKGEPR